MASLNPMVQAADVLVQLVTFAVERQYLGDLNFEKVSVASPSLPDWRTSSRFLRFTQVGYAQEQDQHLGLQNIHNALAGISGTGHSLVAAYCGSGSEVRMYTGVRAQDLPGRPDSYEVGLQLGRALKSNLPGVEFETHVMEGESTPLCPSDEILNQILVPLARYPYAAAITGIPSLRAGGEGLDQSIDRLLNSLADERFLLLLIAEPVPLDQIYRALHQVHAIASDVHSYVRLNLSMGESLGTSQTLSATRGTSETVSAGSSRGESNQTGESAYKHANTMMGLSSVGMFAGGIMSLIGGPVLGSMLAGVSNYLAGAGGPLGLAGQGNASQGRQDSQFESRGTTSTSSETSSATESETRQRTLGIERLDKAAEACEKLLDQAAERLQEGKGLGLWRTGVYLLAENKSTLAQACSQFRALMAGEQSRLEPMRVLDISALRGRGLESALCQFALPEITHDDGDAAPLHHPLGPAFDGLATPLHTDELALTFNLPRREVRGVKLLPVADFGLNPTAPRAGEKSIRLGRLANLGNDKPHWMTLPLKALAGHALVVGITGGGKTNTVKWLLQELARAEVPFLVVEPAKREYATLAQLPDLYGEVQAFTLGDESGNPLRINPFEFAPGFSLLTHIDRLKSIFNASFPMYAAMPYMLEEALLDVYTERGWDLASGDNRYLSRHEDAQWWEYLPTLEDLYGKIDEVVAAKGYAAEPTANYGAALKARISSLMVGGKGMMLNVRRGLPLDLLLDRSTVVQFTGVGDDDEKCFLMGLLFNLLGEYRDVQSREAPVPDLRHVCVIEEAHRLLRQTGTADNPEVASPRAKAVESFANMLAEMRAMGQGFVLADQIPSKLISDAVKNTNLKIVHRLVSGDDVGQMAMGMDLEDDQRRVIVKLPTGQAVIRGASDDSAFLVQMPECEPASLAASPPGQERAVRHQTAFRWKLCEAVCQRPCEYYGRLRTLNESTIAAADELIDRIVLGDGANLADHWQWLLQTLGDATPTGDADGGLLVCRAVTGLQEGMKRRMAGGGANWGAFDGAVRAFGRLLSEVQGGTSVEDSLVAVRELLLPDHKAKPLLKAACSQCKAVCRYGAMMKRVWAELPIEEVLVIDQRGSRVLTSPERLAEILADHCPWLQPGDRIPATYCLSVWLRQAMR